MDPSHRTVRQRISDAVSSARQRVGDAVTTAVAEVRRVIVRCLWGFALWADEGKSPEATTIVRVLLRSALHLTL